MANYVNSRISLKYADDFPQLLEFFGVIGEIGICEYYWSKHQEELEASGLSRSDYTQDFSIMIENGIWGKFIDFESKWSPINLKFIELLHRDIGDFYYTWEEEQGFGEDYDVFDGDIILTEAWDIPEWEEVELPNGDLLFHLVRPWRDLPSGYYADSYTDIDYFYSESLNETMEMISRE